MAKEILKDEILNDEEFDFVTGGTYTQTFQDMETFSKGTNFQFTGSSSDRREQLRDILYRCGIKIKDHGGSTKNEYYILNNQGEKVRSVDENFAMNYAITNYNNGNFIC